MSYRTRLVAAGVVVVFLVVVGIVGEKIRTMQGQVAGLNTQVDAAKVAGLVVPHHELAKEMIIQSLSQVDSTKSNFDLLVLIGPSHLGPQGQFVTTTETLPQTNLSQEEVATLTSQLPFVFIDSEFILTEQSIMVPLTYINELFPGMPVLPLAISPTYQPEQLELLVEVLTQLNNGRVLYILSQDFSHESVWSEAWSRHQEIDQVLSDFDYPKLRSLNDKYLDAPVPTEIFLKIMENLEAKTWQMWDQSHGALILNRPDLQGTSYITGGFMRIVNRDQTKD